MEEEITIRKLVENDRKSVTAIFVEAYFNQLIKLDANPNKLEQIFYNAFLLDHFYGAFLNNELVGFFALTNEKERCLKINKKDVCINILGIKGFFAYIALKKEFEHKIKLQESGFNIESVATSKKHQGKGIATKMMKYAMERNSYLELDVLDINKRAHNIYERIGFKVFKEKSITPLFRSIVGYNKRIYMNYKKVF